MTVRVLQTSDLRCPVTGKHAYPDEASAREQLRVAWQRPHSRRSTAAMPWRVYLCPDCCWWHLASGTNPGKGAAPDGY